MFLHMGFIDQIRCCPCARGGREQCRTMQIDKVFIDQIRYVAYVHGMAGNHADGWGLSHLEPLKSQPTLIESSQIGVPICFFIRVL